MRIWPTWSSLSGQKKSGKRFSISKEEKGSWRPLYLLCKSSSCTRSSPSPASAPPSRAGSRPSTPPCPSPSQTRCIENSYSCIRLANTEKTWENMKIFLLFLYKSLLLKAHGLVVCGLTFGKIYNIGCQAWDRMRGKSNLSKLFSISLPAGVNIKVRSKGWIGLCTQLGFGF